MFSIPISLTAADILGPEDSMSRDGYQHCVLRLTTGRNPRWYCRYTKRVITGPRQSRSIQTRKYFGLKEKMTRREAGHALRRTFATYFEAAGAASLREQMGHSNETMSLQYVRRGFDDNAAAVNRMAGFLLGDTGETTSDSRQNLAKTLTVYSGHETAILTESITCKD